MTTKPGEVRRYIHTPACMVATDPLADFRNHPYFDRAEKEVEECLPPQMILMDREAVRALMVLSWVRGAAWQSHGTN